MKNKKIITALVSLLIFCSAAFAQGPHGLYSICDPENKYINTKEEWLTLEELLKGSVEDITIIEFHGGWKNKQEAKEQIMNKLQDSKIRASSLPRWNLDIPVELVGIIEYKNGSTGKIAVAHHRVGFQDDSGKPWYFQWEERIPWK